MSEEEELLAFGSIMYRVDKQGNRTHIPREEWDMFYRDYVDQEETSCTPD